MIYDMRIREILIHEFQVESEDLKSAFLTGMKKAHSKKFNSAPIGRYFELESLNQGKRNEFTNDRKPCKGAIHNFAKGKNNKT